MGKKLPINEFKEETGRGFKAEIQGTLIQVGSAEYLNIVSSDLHHESRVYYTIGEKQGCFIIQSSYRKGIFEMLKSLKTIYLLTLSPYFDGLYFRQKPKDKLNFMKQHDQDHLMIGDGLNDAGALKEASVGIAISEDIHQFSPACDGILSSEKVSKIPSILDFSKRTINIVFVAFGISFLYNIVGLSFAMTGHLTPLISAILMPISSVTVVGFVTAMVFMANRRLTNQTTTEV